MFAQHRAVLLSLGEAGWLGWRVFMLGAWRDLLAVALWLLLGLATPLPLLPLALLFGPPAIALLLVRLEESPAFVPARRPGGDEKI